MAAHLSSPAATKYFLQPWTLTTPSRPDIKYHRATPGHFEAWLPIIINPANNALMDDVKNTIWTSEEIRKWKMQNIASYNKSLIDYHHLSILVSENDQMIGYGDLFLLKNGNYNIGVVIDTSAQGKGIGKLTASVFIQLAFEIGNKGVESGTMKANEAFRGVMRSLGVKEEEKLVVTEGRGILAELSYEVEREKWRDIELDVIWGEGVSEKVDEVV